VTDWPESRGDAARRGGLTDGLTPPLLRLWRAHAGRSAAAPPVALGTAVLVTTTDRQVRLLDAATGAKIWRHRLTSPASAVPIAAGGRAYVASGDPEPALHALELETGRPVWIRHDLHVRGGPVARGDTLFVTTVAGEALALRAPTGETIWRVETPWLWPAPLAHAPGVVLGCGEADSLRAFASATGARRWARPIPGGSRGGPAVAGSRVFVCSNEGTLAAYAVGDGTPAWACRLPSRVYAPPAVGDRWVFVAGLDGRLYAVGTEDGAIAWSAQLEGACRGGAAVAAGAIVAVTMDARCHLVSIAEGRITYTLDFSRPLGQAPVIFGRRLFAIDDAGDVYAFESS
jgi:outer membrane protein assembly factor BamB